MAPVPYLLWTPTLPIDLTQPMDLYPTVDIYPAPWTYTLPLWIYTQVLDLVYPTTLAGGNNTRYQWYISVTMIDT